MTQEQKNVIIPGVAVNTSTSTFPAPVGIGSSDPQSVLHIFSASPVVKVEDSASGTTASPNIQFLASDVTMGFIGYTGSGMQLLNARNTPLVISTNNLERVRITQSGNMGIGMTAPTTALGVSGSGSFSGIVSASGISAVGATFAGNISVGGIMVGAGSGTPTIGVPNTAIGRDALKVNVDGWRNTAVGSDTLLQNTTGDMNTAVGANALVSNINGTSNTAIGVHALAGVTSGGSNIAIGTWALYTNQGSSNTAIGNSALYFNTGGAHNIAIGNSTSYKNTTASNNIAIGNSVLYKNETSQANVGIGVAALNYIESGGSNTAIGDSAGEKFGSGTYLTTATKGVFIGASTKASADGNTNEIVIGSEAVGLGSNTAVIGKTTQTAATIYGMVTASLGVTAPRMFTSSMTASTLHVTGTTTLAGVTAQSLWVSGGITAGTVTVTDGLSAGRIFTPSLTATTLHVTGVSTLAGVTAARMSITGGLSAATVFTSSLTVAGPQLTSNATFNHYTDLVAGSIQSGSHGEGVTGVCQIILPYGLTASTQGGVYDTTNWPAGGDTMLRIKIMGHQYRSSATTYGASWEVIAHGYFSPAYREWSGDHLSVVEIRGNAPFSKVRLANKTNASTYPGRAAILLGDDTTTWKVADVGTRVQVTDLSTHHSGNAVNWADNWVVEPALTTEAYISANYVSAMTKTPKLYEYMDMQGNLGLGGVTAPAAKLHVAGTGLFTGGLSAASMFTPSLTATTLHVTGVSTLGGVAADSLNVVGGVTAPRMFTASLTATALHVTGVSTLAGVTASNLYVSGGVTAAASLAVVGVSTLAGVTAESLFVKNGLTAAGSLGVVGNITVGQSIDQLKAGMTPVSNMSFISNGAYPTFNRIVVGTDGTGYKFAISSATSSSSIIDRLTINTGNGFVGIGITTPACALDVSGTIRASTNLIVSGTANVSGVTTLVGVTADSMFVKGGVTAATVSATTFNGALVGNATTATTLKDAAFNRITNPAGGYFENNSSTAQTGAIKVTLPVSWTNTMMRIKISVYDYSIRKSFDVVCGGYNYAGSSGVWVHTFAYIEGDGGTTTDINYNIRFGHDGTKCAIWIGEAQALSQWSAYGPKVAITEVMAGHSAGVDLSTGWVISIDPVTPSNLSYFITPGLRSCAIAPTQPFHLANKAYVDGISEVPTANNASYTKLPNGTLMQWGRTPSVNANASATVTFPTAFSANCLPVVTTTTVGIQTTGILTSCHAAATSTAVTVHNNYSAAAVIEWIAMGY